MQSAFYVIGAIGALAIVSAFAAGECAVVWTTFTKSGRRFPVLFYPAELRLATRSAAPVEIEMTASLGVSSSMQMNTRNGKFVL